MIYLQFERHSEMFTIIAILVLGIVKVECAQTQCQMIAIKTKTGLAGHCCIYSKEAISENRIVEQIFKSPQVTNGRVKLTQKTPDMAEFVQPKEHEKVKFHDMAFDVTVDNHRQQLEKIAFTESPSSKNEFNTPRPDKNKFTQIPSYMTEFTQKPLDVVKEDNQKSQSTMPPQRNHKITRRPVNRSSRPDHPTKSSDENFQMFDRTTHKSSTNGQFSGSTSTEESKSSSEEANSFPSTIPGNNSASSNKTTVQVDNRFNIGAPKICNQSTKKTSNGECESPFG